MPRWISNMRGEIFSSSCTEHKILNARPNFFVFCCSVETRFVCSYTSTICFFLENCFAFASWAHSNSTQEIASRAKKLDRAANLHELLHARRIRGQAAAISITEHWCYRFTLGKYLRWKPKLWFMAKCVACRPQCNRLRNYITRKVVLNPAPSIFSSNPYLRDRGLFHSSKQFGVTMRR